MNASPARILLVEDDPHVRKLFRRKLSTVGYGIIEASNGKEGLRRYRQEAPDLVITDLVMPEREGIEMITQLFSEFPDAKIIAVSGGGRSDPGLYLEVAAHLGAKKTFEKPVDWEALMAEVRKLIGP